MELSIHAARLMRKPCEPAPMLSDDGVACDIEQEVQLGPLPVEA
jgi:hypothetical protein